MYIHPILYDITNINIDNTNNAVATITLHANSPFSSTTTSLPPNLTDPTTKAVNTKATAANTILSFTFIIVPKRSMYPTMNSIGNNEMIIKVLSTSINQGPPPVLTTKISCA